MNKWVKVAGISVSLIHPLLKKKGILFLFTLFYPSFSLHFQSYSSQGRGNSGGGGGGGAGDEDYEIPPITPPNHADPSLLHLMEHESGYPFHSLPHNGLLNTYSYPELPALMMSNMLGQDTHLLSGPMHSVSTVLFLFLFFCLSLFSSGPLWSCKSSAVLSY